MKYCQICFCLLLSVFNVNSIMFYLPPNAQKCLRENLKKDDLVIGSYEVTMAPKQHVDYIVTDSKGHTLSQGSDIGKGKFTIVVETEETYEICFKSRVEINQRGVQQEVSFTSKLEVKSYENLGEALKLKPMEVELKALEQLSHSIVKDFESMRESEIKMSNTNESTNNRVIYFSFFGVFCLFCLSTWQVYYFRKYFKSKKLIE
ncbi:transmembrane emp24 domain-containing protein bai [Cimex lectularius]|uniref:GOLD domain-containing protein n=1 Tax=Cimex lectularius TaxID=79782 RepID=A0A8I6RP69_CIMLE|nr:transmembrane emp24 domain-containing protein bai [Cimex lectularius]